MYCKHCGNPVDPNSAVCVKCGAPVGQGGNFCANCGNHVDPNAVVCLSCGYSLNGGAVAQQGAKSKMAAGLLAIFLGTYGVHNFYLGYIGKAVVQLCLTILGIITACFYIGFLFVIATWIWSLIEGIMIFSGSIKTDAKGIPLKD